MKRIKKIIQLFPILAIILIFIASVKNYIYYNHFGLNIFDFWKLDEIISSFLDEIVIIVLLLVSSFLFVVVQSIFGPRKSDNPLKEESIIHEKPEDFVKKIRKLRNFLITILILFIFSIALAYFTRKVTFYYANAVITTILFVFFMVHFLSNHIIRKKSFQILYRYYPAIVLYILFISSSYLAMKDINEVKFKEHYFGTILDFNDNKIISNSSQYYIGKTNDYLFVYNELEELCFVYQTKDLKKIIFATSSSNKNRLSNKGIYKDFKDFRKQINDFTE